MLVRLLGDVAERGEVARTRAELGTGAVVVVVVTVRGVVIVDPSSRSH